jgi:hypothetical protein
MHCPACGFREDVLYFIPQEAPSGEGRVAGPPSPASEFVSTDWDLRVGCERCFRVAVGREPADRERAAATWKAPPRGEDVIPSLLFTGIWFLIHPGGSLFSLWLIPYSAAAAVIASCIGFARGRRHRRERLARLSGDQSNESSSC